MYLFMNHYLTNYLFSPRIPNALNSRTENILQLSCQVLSAITTRYEQSETRYFFNCYLLLKNLENNQLKFNVKSLTCPRSIFLKIEIQSQPGSDKCCEKKTGNVPDHFQSNQPYNDNSNPLQHGKDHLVDSTSVRCLTVDLP